MTSSTITSNTEIRKLKPAHRYALGDILNVSDSWKKLMAIVPQSGTNTSRFNSEHVNIIEQAAQKYRQSAAEILLDEWSTMGRERPTVQLLLDLLIRAELFRAADYVAGEILNVELPQRPQYGPAAVVDISDETLAKLIDVKAKFESNECDEPAVICESSCEVNAGEIRCFPDAIDLMDPSVNMHINEVKSEELPTFLNQSSFLLHKAVICSDNKFTCPIDVNNSSNSSNCNSSLKNVEKSSMIFQLQTEVTSSLLPQCVIDRKEDDGVVCETNENNKSVTNSNDLPLMVLEYNS